MDYLADQDAVVLVLFRLRDQPVIPSVATYTLYDTDGSVLLTDQAISLGPTSTEANITVPANLNGISTNFEKRTLLIKYTYQTRHYTQRQSFRLTGFLNYTVTPKDVRNYLGVNEFELTDEQIDLVDAYFMVAPLISSALSGGDQKEAQANKAILYQCALNIIPSLQLRVAQKETNGLIGFDRAPIKDFSELKEITEALLASALDIASGRTTADYPFAVLGQPVDVITGA